MIRRHAKLVFISILVIVRMEMSDGFYGFSFKGVGEWGNRMGFLRWSSDLVGSLVWIFPCPVDLM